MRISHALFTPAYIGMILPLGIRLNSFLLHMERGDEVVLYGNVRARLRLVQKVEANNPLLGTLCMMLYGRTLDELMDTLAANYGKTMYADTFLVVLVVPDMSGDEMLISTAREKTIVEIYKMIYGTESLQDKTFGKRKAVRSSRRHRG